MSRPKAAPKSCNRAVSEGVKAAVSAVRLRGAQITPLREAALKALWSAERPLGAYELRDRLTETLGRAVAAPSIYRTLDFLCEQGVAARIESRNAYVACAHPENDHLCVFLVCEACGDSREIEDPRLEKLIGEDARRVGFAVRRRIVEMSGLCAPCQRAS
ncbi:MAG: Fur family transcriptional regulator [Pseudomonadota bacterium]